MSAPSCRLCGNPLTRTFVDLGMSPPCEDFLAAEELDAGETFYPLHVRICDHCLLVQLPPSLEFDAAAAQGFFTALRRRWPGGIATEPRHASWFGGEAQDR